MKSKTALQMLLEMRQKAAKEPAVVVYPSDWPMAGYVYLLRAGGRYKIGQTANPKKRFRSLTTNSPYPIEIIAMFYLPGYQQTERDLHLKYAERRRHGEWFEFTNAEIVEIIDGLYRSLINRFSASEDASAVENHWRAHFHEKNMTLLGECSERIKDL